MRSRIAIYAAQFCTCKPWGLVAHYLGVNHLGNVAANSIHCQRRRIRTLFFYHAFRNQSQLNQCLEAVADAKHQTVPFVQQFFNLFFDNRISKYGCKELCRTFRLVACGETAWEHNDLRLCNLIFVNFYRLSDIFCAQVLKYFCHNLGAGSLKRLGAVVFAVGSWEYRNKYIRLANLMIAYVDGICFVQFIRNRSLLYAGSGREYALQCFRPGIQSLFHGNLGIAIFKNCPIGYFADYGIADRQFSHLFCWNFQYQIAPSGCKEVSWIQVMFNLYAQLVAKCHLADCFCDSLSFYCISRKDLSCLNLFKHFAVTVHNLCVIRQIILVFFNGKQHNLAAWLLKLRSDDCLRVRHIDCKGNQGRRNVDFAMLLVIKGSGHTVLSSDGRQSESHLGAVSAK